MAIAAGEPTVLIHRALGLGDFLTAVPALRGLRRVLPGHRLVLATHPALAALCPLTGAVDEVCAAQGVTHTSWSGEPLDLAVNLHGRGPQSHRLLRRLGPRRLVAFGRPDLGVPGPRWEDDEHEVQRWCRLVATEFGVAVDATDIVLARPPWPPLVEDCVIVHPGATSAARRWPAERFAKVAAALANSGAPVVVTGSAAEGELAEEVAASAGLPSRSVLAGRTSLPQLASLVSTARLVVCSDTGIAHLASAFGTPSVVLFGPVSPNLWGPPGGGLHLVLWHGHNQPPGDPHGTRLDPALERIQVADVVEAASSLLDRTEPAGAASAPR